MKNKLQIIVTIILVIVSLSIGFVIGNLKNSKKEKIEVSNEEDFARLMIEKFSLEDFFYEVYPSENNLNKNLLEENIDTLIYNQNELNRYIVEYKETDYIIYEQIIPSLTETITVIKYQDYKEVYKKVLDKEYPNNADILNNNYIKFENLNLKSSLYYGRSDIYSYDNISKCNIKNMNDCYIVIDWQNNVAGGYFPPRAILKNYKVNNNLIKADLFYKEIAEETPTKVATIELEYKLKENKYYLESLKVVSLENND